MVAMGWVLLVAASVVGPSLLVTALGYVPDVWEWVRGGPYPWKQRSPEQQLAIDLFRAKGLTRRAATRKVGYLSAFHTVRADTGDLMRNPAREGELRDVANRMQQSFEDGSMPEPLRAQWKDAQRKLNL